MKVLVIQENGRHDANRNYRECFSLQRAFSNLGHSCDVWGLGHLNYNTPPDFNSYDLIFNLENYTEEWLPNLSQIKNPMKVMWSIDAHVRGEEVFEDIFKKSKYDYLLHSTVDFVKDKHHIWFPNGYDEHLIKPMEIEKKIDFGFCGNFVNREPILRWLNENHNLHLDIFVIGDAMVKSINSYKCHFNLNIANDINYRSFETMGCKTLLMTNGNHQYDKLGFVDNENCLIYNNITDIQDKINQFREMSDDEINNVASKGHEFIKYHTYTKRVEKLLGDLK
jgi:hypothetical protein